MRSKTTSQLIHILPYISKFVNENRFANYDKKREGSVFMRKIIKNAKIYPCDAPIIENGYVVFGNGKISELGDMKDFEGGEAFDAEGGILLPGLIDAHSHLGNFGEGVRFEGYDGNEETDPITPHLRIVDATNPFDAAFNDAREAGVTTVVTSPGSANPIGGQGIAIKTRGVCIDDMIIKEPATMKLAFGENPKMTYKGKGPNSRMAAAALTREAFIKAEEYGDSRLSDSPCSFDMKHEALLAVLSGELPVHIHCHRQDDIFSAVRISKEFDLKTVLVHASEGHLVAERLACENIPVICGPIINNRSKPELANISADNVAKLAKAGIKVAICTDHPEIPQQYLMLSAALASREGIDEYEALRMITINAAEIAGIDERVGSITVGKDADFVLYDGHPFDNRSKVKAVWIDGEKIK